MLALATPSTSNRNTVTECPASRVLALYRAARRSYGVRHRGRAPACGGHHEGNMATEVQGTRARILSLSAELFATRGYHGTGMSDLLREAGVARGGFYHHFRSKEDVLLEIVVGAIEDILRSSAAVLALDLDPSAKLRLLCDDLSDAIIDNQSGFIVFLREYSALGHDAQERVLGLRRSYLQRWEQVLETGVRAGVFVARATPYTEGILGMWIYTFAYNRGATDPHVIASDLADFVLRGTSTSSNYSGQTGPASVSPSGSNGRVERSTGRETYDER